MQVVLDLLLINWVELSGTVFGSMIKDILKQSPSFRGQRVHSQKKLHIVVVDDHPVVRQGIAAILSNGIPGVVIEEAVDAKSALLMLEKTLPDLVITDVSLPEINGIEFVKQAISRWPSQKFLVLTRHTESLYAERALRAGARGFINKSEAGQTLVESIRRIVEGHIYVTKSAKSHILNGISDLVSAKTPVERFSDRELEVFEHVGHGASRVEIARAMNVSVKTVDSYRSRLKDKLGVRTTSQLVQSAVQWVQLSS